MTLQQSFERGNFIEFIPSDNIVILHFQQEAIRDEFYEDLKNELKETPLQLGIEVIDEEKLMLTLDDLEGNNIYTNQEIRYRGTDILDKFIANNSTTDEIKLYTDILVFPAEGFVIPSSHEWMQQQSDPDKPILQGYHVL